MGELKMNLDHIVLFERQANLIGKRFDQDITTDLDCWVAEVSSGPPPHLVCCLRVTIDITEGMCYVMAIEEATYVLGGCAPTRSKNYNLEIRIITGISDVRIFLHRFVLVLVALVRAGAFDISIAQYSGPAL